MGNWLDDVNVFNWACKHCVYEYIFCEQYERTQAQCEPKPCVPLLGVPSISHLPIDDEWKRSTGSKYVHHFLLKICTFNWKLQPELHKSCKSRNTTERELQSSREHWANVPEHNSKHLFYYFTFSMPWVPLWCSDQTQTNIDEPEEEQTHLFSILYLNVVD